MCIMKRSLGFRFPRLRPPQKELSARMPGICVQCAKSWSRTRSEPLLERPKPVRQVTFQREPFGNVIDIIVKSMAPSPGGKVEIKEAYFAYAQACKEQGKKPFRRINSQRRSSGSVKRRVSRSMQKSTASIF